MRNYFISDIHGCYEELRLILKKSSFNDQKDYLWIAGDLVSRGSNSLEVMRYLYSFKERVKITLGNHDLNLISVYCGVKKNKKENHFDEFLSAKDSLKLIHWLRKQSILKCDIQKKIIMSHAGISPNWNIDLAKKYASEIEFYLSSPDYCIFLKNISNNKVNSWNNDDTKINKLKYSINAFTRMRYCYSDFRLNLICKESPKTIKFDLFPWFKIQHYLPKKYSVFFGHWSSLKNIKVYPPFFPLDHGCCWGGELMLLRWEDKKYFYQSYLKN